jgi:hypothetical protein
MRKKGKGKQRSRKASCRTILVDEVARDKEERDAGQAGRRAIDTREHNMDDVLGQIVVAGGDEDLWATKLAR